MGFQPLQYPPRALETGGVYQGVKDLPIHFQGVGLALAGGAGLQGNGDGIILGQSGNHAGFAFVRVPNDGKRRCLCHKCSPSAE